jgi:hypothetical protein
MITYTPSEIIAAQIEGYQLETRNYLPLYEHLARKVLEWNLPKELLVDTSGTGYSSFAGIGSHATARRILAKLFSTVGNNDFLYRLGIRRWRDLDKPIIITGVERYVQITYDVCERRLQEPGPNSCHPGAIYGQSCYFVFGSKRHWHFVVSYGYSRDSSTWYTGVAQTNESLDTFLRTTVPAWMSAHLEPEQWAAPREERNRKFSRLSSAVDELFGCESYSDEQVSTDALTGFLMDASKPRLTRERLDAIRAWIRQDAAKHRRYEAKRKEG